MNIYLTIKCICIKIPTIGQMSNRGDNDLNEIKENVIEWINGDDHACVTANQQKLINKLLKLAEQRPDEVHIIQNKDGSVCADIPQKWVKIHPSQVLTDEQRIQRSERMKKLAEQRKVES